MKYMFLYYGQPSESDAERTHGMQLMAEWYGKLGEAVVDPGKPFTDARRVTKDGPTHPGMGSIPTGYTIVEAPNMATATDLAADCPLIPAGREVHVLETRPMG